MQFLESAPVRNENVQIAIVVVVKKGSAPPNLLDAHLSQHRRIGFVDKSDACLGIVFLF